FYFLLHMLTTVALQGVDYPLNDLLQSLPLHHAASAGRIANVAYLLYTCKAKPEAQDGTGNTAAHIAYLNGHKTLGTYLMTKYPYLQNTKNSAKKTPDMIKEAHNEYEDLYEMNVKDSESEENIEITEQTNENKLITKLMVSWLQKTKGKGFKSLVEKNVIDYSKGEAKTLLTLATNFAQSIGDGIARINSTFKGKLVLVGSAGDKARLYAPDEFDFTWVLDWDDVISEFVEMPIKEQLKNRYKHKILLNSETPEIKKLLHKTNLLDEFFDCAQEAIKEIIPSLDPRLTLISPGIKHIGCGVCLSLAWYGKEYQLLIVNIDLVPSIKTRRPNNFPQPLLAERFIINPHLEPAYIVQTHIGEGEYRTATTLVEQQIMLDPSLEHQSFVFMIAKLMISKLKSEKWAPLFFKDRFRYFDSQFFKIPTPSGFMLKSAYFHELENLPNAEDWKGNCIVNRLRGIFKAMCRKTEDTDILYSGMIHNYFSPTTQPAERGLMAPAILNFIQDNENELILKQAAP
ncbi:unnamed protein product, partial [Meganyctiphanes norvegica]